MALVFVGLDTERWQMAGNLRRIPTGDISLLYKSSSIRKKIKASVQFI